MLLVQLGCVFCRCFVDSPFAVLLSFLYAIRCLTDNSAAARFAFSFPDDETNGTAGATRVSATKRGKAAKAGSATKRAKATVVKREKTSVKQEASSSDESSSSNDSSSSDADESSSSDDEEDEEEKSQQKSGQQPQQTTDSDGDATMLERPKPAAVIAPAGSDAASAVGSLDLDAMSDTADVDLTGAATSSAATSSAAASSAAASSAAAGAASSSSAETCAANSTAGSAGDSSTDAGSTADAADATATTAAARANGAADSKRSTATASSSSAETAETKALKATAAKRKRKPVPKSRKKGRRKGKRKGKRGKGDADEEEAESSGDETVLMNPFKNSEFEYFVKYVSLELILSVICVWILSLSAVLTTDAMMFLINTGFCFLICAVCFRTLICLLIELGRWQGFGNKWNSW